MTVAETASMSMVLGWDVANNQSPGPRGARDDNSPAKPAMRHQRGHDADVSPFEAEVNSASSHQRSQRIESFVALVSKGSEGRGLQEDKVVKHPVVSGAEARAGTKEGIVRYILVASLALVVVLLIVAYELFS